MEFADYRDLHGSFDKIASVGMFEHAGGHRLRGYFTKVHAMLAPEGLFLNHGIARPETVKPGADWMFLQRNVFPGAELPHLSEVVREAEKAGFEALDVENLRPHYARNGGPSGAVGKAVEPAAEALESTAHLRVGEVQAGGAATQAIREVPLRTMD